MTRSLGTDGVSQKFLGPNNSKSLTFPNDNPTETADDGDFRLAAARGATALPLFSKRTDIEFEGPSRFVLPSQH